MGRGLARGCGPRTCARCARAWWGTSRFTPGTPWHPVGFAVDPTLALRHFQGLSGAFRDFQLLKIKHDKLLSNVAFNFNMRHYIVVISTPVGRCRLTPG